MTRRSVCFLPKEIWKPRVLYNDLYNSCFSKDIQTVPWIFLCKTKLSFIDTITKVHLGLTHTKISSFWPHSNTYICWAFAICVTLCWTEHTVRWRTSQVPYGYLYYLENWINTCKVLRTPPPHLTYSLSASLFWPRRTTPCEEWKEVMCRQGWTYR